MFKTSPTLNLREIAQWPLKAIKLYLVEAFTFRITLMLHLKEFLN